ncbi:MAG: hypothetical protein EBX52_08410 [Proteobacteria bacterium]|nr:hypothetical protein [Pseudomonadota bacterium]
MTGALMGIKRNGKPGAPYPIGPLPDCGIPLRVKRMNPLHGPLFAQALLTFLVWFALVVYRVTVIKLKRIDPQVLADEAKNQEIYRAGVHLSDNFENLFEVPVLFFAGILVSIQTGFSDEKQLLLAWTFVALRSGHTLVHVTFNHITTRFSLYLISTLCCLGIWIRLAMHAF